MDTATVITIGISAASLLLSIYTLHQARQDRKPRIRVEADYKPNGLDGSHIVASLSNQGEKPIYIDGATVGKGDIRLTNLSLGKARLSILNWHRFSVHRIHGPSILNFTSSRGPTQAFLFSSEEFHPFWLAPGEPRIIRLKLATDEDLWLNEAISEKQYPRLEIHDGIGSGHKSNYITRPSNQIIYSLRRRGKPYTGTILEP